MLVCRQMARAGRLKTAGPQKGASRKRQRGFTLLELLIVVIILGLLAALVGPELFGTLDKAKRQIAKTQIENLTAALNQYRLDVGMYPTTEEGLAALITPPGEETGGWGGPYLEKGVIPKDPWNREYIYNSPGEQADFEIISYGRDGKPGGEKEDKDITSWE